MITPSNRKQSKRRKRKTSEQIGNINDVYEVNYRIVPEEKIFKRSSYHIAIAYHIHLRNNITREVEDLE